MPEHAPEDCLHQIPLGGLAHAFGVVCAATRVPDTAIDARVGEGEGGRGRVDDMAEAEQEEGGGEDLGVPGAHCSGEGR